MTCPIHGAVTDDLEAALKMEYFDVVGGNEWVVIPRVLKEKLIERLDRDRKMKAELATLLEDAERVTLTYWAKYPRWTVEQQLDKLAEECEEVARAIGDGESKDRQAEEISDVIFSALSMSHILNISTEKIEEALWHKLTIIQDRANKRTKLEAADSKTEASE